jgi:zinc transporter ZupT
MAPCGAIMLAWTVESSKAAVATTINTILAAGIIFLVFIVVLP